MPTMEPKRVSESSPRGDDSAVDVNVAKTFLASAKRLPAAERGRVLDFLDKFMNNPAHPGISLERVRNTGSEDLWSARVTQNLRVILHRDGPDNTLLFAGRHDEAYQWAERRSLSQHPVTGTLQIVEDPRQTDEKLQATPEGAYQPDCLFEEFDDAYLLSLGLPENWLPTLRRVRFDDQVLTVVERLPEEVGERLLALASGEFVTPPAPAKPETPAADNSEQARRFWVVRDADELREVLNRPWTDWVTFLHPSQRKLATGQFRGPVKVTGAAGTGKTVVALHRASHLARQGKQVLLTTFVSTLCRNLDKNISLLAPDAVRARITVETVHHCALNLARRLQPDLRPLESKELREWLEELKSVAEADFPIELLLSEWNAVVESQGIASWEDYRDAPRTASQPKLAKRQRQNCWRIFCMLRERMQQQSAYPWERICSMARLGLESGQLAHPFDAVIVDEIQDLAPEALLFLTELARPARENFFLVGDAGQRIYPGGFSLRSLGIDVRGRSHVLRINYRTTEQIRRFADRLLPERSDDLDNADYQRRSHCLIGGPNPQIQGFKDSDDENQFLADQIQNRLEEGLGPKEIAVFARVGSRLESLGEALQTAGIQVHRLSRDDEQIPENAVCLGTMHRAKGLEFKVVFAIDCSEAVLPHEKALQSSDAAEDRDGVLRERQLLYVTLTRARDEAVITWSKSPSPFLAAYGD